MRKLGWYAVSAIVGVLILGSVLLLGANLYVQSLAVQHRIRQALADSLKMPVSLRKTTITPWDGLRIDGIVAHFPGQGGGSDQPARPDFLVAESFRVRFALAPLVFGGHFVIRQVLLDHPQLSWPQDAEGRWRFPPGDAEHAAKVKKPKHHPKDAEPVVAETSPAGTPAAVVEAPSSPRPKKTATHETATPKDAPALSIDLIKLRHGTIDLLDSKDRLFGHFEEVDVDGHLADLAHATGFYGFEKAALPTASLLLTKFRGAFTYVQDTELNLAAGHGELAGGHILLTYHVQMSEPGSPFRAEGHLQDVSIERLFAEAGSQLQPIAGRLQGNVTASGLSDDDDSRQATGHFQLLDTHLKNLPLLQALGGALRIQDLSHLEFRKAELDCQLHGETLTVDPLVLESGDLQVLVRGQYLIDEDRLDLHARLVIDQAISHQLPQFIESNFTPGGDDLPNERYVDFVITGPLSRPATDLFDKVISGPMNGFFANLLAPKQKGGNKKNPKHPKVSEPPAAPASSPVSFPAAASPVPAP